MLTLSAADRPVTTPRRAEQERVRTFLPEVQALRALAVGLVVLYHFWPLRLTGGFVGVDVFFVISGFLITSHLHREVVSTGRIRLSAFYARRARRLLPASMLVLLVTAGATFVYLPVTRWTATAADIVASTFYVQNWVLAERAVDYSAAGRAASAVQHFWSLSVEEQFYLAWPPLILLFLLLARRLPTLRRDTLLLGGILTVTVLSLAYSVYATAADAAAAYFVTPTRIWELGAGAALALWSQRRSARPSADRAPRAWTAIGLRWAGLVAILAAAIGLSAASAFPGYLALLPVLGTVAVIAAGNTGPRDPLSPLVGLRPTQFLGDVSYSLYLWHWPVVVVAPFALGRAPAATDKLALIALCVVLAWLTKIAVETPTQKWRALARPAIAAAFTVAAMVVVTGVAGLQWQEVREREDAARARLAALQDAPCFGAAALDEDGPACADRFATPALGRVAGDEPWFEDPACQVTEAPLRVATCRWGSGPPTAKVALVGDSHAEHWRGALHRVAEANGWEIVEMLRAACPVTAVPVLTFAAKPIDTEGCRSWGAQVHDRLLAEAPDAVFTSAFAGRFGFEDDDPEQSLATGARGFVDVWTEWAAAGSQVFVLRDPPTTGGRDIPECLATHVGAPLECASPRAEAVRPDAMTVAASQVESPRVQLVDLTDYFCDEATCYGAIGRAPVYQDFDHISAAYSRSLAPYLLERIGGGLG